MPEFIRVRVKDSGTEQTIAKPPAVDPDVYEVLDEPALDHSERPLPPKFPESSESDDNQSDELDELDDEPDPELDRHNLVAGFSADDDQKESDTP